MDTKEFTKRLTTDMTWYDVTEENLSAKSNIPIARIKALLNGREPTASELLAIAQAFNCSVDYYLGRTDVYEVALQAPLRKVDPGWLLCFIPLGERELPVHIISDKRKVYFLVITNDTTLRQQHYEMYFGFCTARDGWVTEDGTQTFPYSRVVAYSDFL